MDLDDDYFKPRVGRSYWIFAIDLGLMAHEPVKGILSI